MDDEQHKQKLKARVEQYTGYEAKSILVFPDPRFMGVYALRVTMSAGETCDFLSYADQLEEVDFDEWPPRVKKL